MSATTETSPKPKLARTDYAVCTCVNGEHHVSSHRVHPRPMPPKEIARRYPNGHLVERTIAWTPWKASS
jgi:hypothetical protein